MTQKINLNDVLPPAPSGYRLGKWQADAPSADPTIVRNASVYQPNFGGTHAQTGTSFSVTVADLGKLVTSNNAAAVAVSLASSLPPDFVCWMRNLGVGAATLTPSTGLIDGVGAFSLSSGQGVALFFNGTDWITGAIGPAGPTGPPGSTGAPGSSITHAEPLTDGSSNFIFANGDIIVAVGVLN